MKKALITGITSQDASYLSELLLARGYEVYGLKRRSSVDTTWRIGHLIDKITILDGDLLDFPSLISTIATVEPDEVYNLAAQSFVGVSWGQPLLTANVNGLGTMRLLEAVRIVNPKIKFYQASTSELFGSSPPPQSESTNFYPRSPYGVSKLFAHYATINYRESYNIFAVAGVLFNHGSPRRGIEFVERKISDGVARIKFGLQTELRLGNLDAVRDFSHSADVMEAAYLMMQGPTPKDYVCGSGEAHTIRELCDLAFSCVGLSYKDHVIVDPKFFRPAEVNALLADPRRIKQELGWKPKISFHDLIKEMVDADMERIRKTL